MPRKLEASYVAKQKIWKRRFKGLKQPLSISIRQLSNGWSKTIDSELVGRVELAFDPQQIASETKEGTREAANLWVAYCRSVLEVRPTKRKTDRIAELEVELAQLQNQLYGASGNAEFVEQTTEEIEDIATEIRQRRVAKQKGIDFDSEVGRRRRVASVFLDGVDQLPATAENAILHKDLQGEPLPDECLISFWKKRFLEVKRAEKKRSPGGLANLKRDLNSFAQFVGDSASIHKIDEKLWESWFIDDRCKKGDSLSRSKAFVKYIYGCKETGFELPRNIDLLKRTKSKGKNKHSQFSLDEIRFILNNTKGDMRVFVWLMVNCGFTQIDIATLTPEMLHDGYITRSRHKEKDGEDLPVVSWRLWDETKSLIEQFRSDKNGLLFTREDGSTWYLSETRTKPDGEERQSKDDRISDLWNEGFRQTYAPRLTLKFLRKAGSHYLPTTNLGSKDHFLGHMPKTVGSSHYYTPHQDEFDSDVLRLRDVIFGNG